MRIYPPIWFLRHGQTVWNKAYRLQGQLDSPLTDQGIAEARRQAVVIAPVLKEAPAIWVSPLGRARQTADIALDGASYQTDPRLMEIHAGRWQGMLRTEIMDAQPDWAACAPSALEIYEAAEGGEGIAAFEARILAFLRDLSGPTVIVAHGLLGQVLRAHVLGADVGQAGALSNLQGVVYHLRDGQEYVLEAPE
ncbi:histidine phosphatase family protein [Sulfitobacter aestuariivivens]|uniref:Histidine phosphatase family protein n=1 Tax=Sulfitobacter aestuariivivens TaxID=2766981 RepID=A0A927D0W6_9RHOB|nr:histidine phosphatase family protein [Sulfitobacter aestuariivivens]MBD3663030.1 histidine phosphatase family protein [Sulfitobacter aestuariivivens]